MMLKGHWYSPNIPLQSTRNSHQKRHLLLENPSWPEHTNVWYRIHTLPIMASVFAPGMIILPEPCLTNPTCSKDVCSIHARLAVGGLAVRMPAYQIVVPANRVSRTWIKIPILSSIWIMGCGQSGDRRPIYCPLVCLLFFSLSFVNHDPFFSF